MDTLAIHPSIPAIYKNPSQRARAPSQWAAGAIVLPPSGPPPALQLGFLKNPGFLYRPMEGVLFGVLKKSQVFLFYISSNKRNPNKEGKECEYFNLGRKEWILYKTKQIGKQTKYC